MGWVWGRVCQQALALAILSILRQERATRDLMHMPIRFIARPVKKTVRVRWDGTSASARTLHLVPWSTQDTRSRVAPRGFASRPQISNSHYSI
ncbi:hypothetical protein C8Q76DRAFT_137932 [Earliella scabrosa]|nr:hypothetical protein C8Q76DRAFT_137932 [Earliella scabrosa]